MVSLKIRLFTLVLYRIDVENGIDLVQRPILPVFDLFSFGHLYSMDYMKEKLLLVDFCKALERSLYQLNVVPVEANGAVFDSHIHETVHIEDKSKWDFFF